MSCAALAAGAGTASATTVDYNGATLVVSGVDSANHEVQFRAGDNGTDEILDTAGFTTIPGDCTVVSNPTWIKCPGHVGVQVTLGSGNDAVYFTGSNFDCFETYSVDLGEGTNRVDLSDQCVGPGVATVTSGGGPDTLTGGSQPAITFFAGGGNDSVYGGTGNDVIHGGEGNDRVLGGAGNDQVLGEGGADTPGGGPGNDVVDGGAGDDALDNTHGAVSGNDAGAGADTYIGGLGVDKLWLDGHSGGMTISLDGQANDGAAGEGDNIGSDIETILGTVSDDVFTGSAGPDSFEGNSGNDEIHGGDGNDDLNGGSGDDKLYGDAGVDKVQGSNGADTIDGGAGTDQLSGDTASCSVFCAFDPDTIFARDGERDTVDCGGGADSAQVDSVDVVAFCSSVDRPAEVPASAPGPAPGPTPGPTPVAAGFALVGTPHIATGVRLLVNCPAACSYKLSLVLSAKTAKRFKLGSRALQVASTSGSLLNAGKKAAKLMLSATARKKLKRAKTVPATLRLTATDAAAKKTVLSKPVTLRH